MFYISLTKAWTAHYLVFDEQHSNRIECTNITEPARVDQLIFGDMANNCCKMINLVITSNINVSGHVYGVYHVYLRRAFTVL